MSNWPERPWHFDSITFISVRKAAGGKGFMPMGQESIHIFVHSQSSHIPRPLPAIALPSYQYVSSQRGRVHVYGTGQCVCGMGWSVYDTGLQFTFVHTPSSHLPRLGTARRLPATARPSSRGRAPRRASRAPTPSERTRSAPGQTFALYNSLQRDDQLLVTVKQGRLSASNR